MKFVVFDYSRGNSPNLEEIDVAASGPAGGDLAGSYPNPTVVQAHGVAFLGASPGAQALGTLLYDASVLDAAKLTLDAARLSWFFDAPAANQLVITRAQQMLFAPRVGATTGNFIFLKDDFSVAYGELDWGTGVDDGVQWTLTVANQWRVKLAATYSLQAVQSLAGAVVGLAVGAAAISPGVMGANTGDNVIYVGKAVTAPTANAVNGYILYVDPADNVLKARGPGGTVTPLALP